MLSLAVPCSITPELDLELQLPYKLSLVSYAILNPSTWYLLEDAPCPPRASFSNYSDLVIWGSTYRLHFHFLVSNSYGRLDATSGRLFENPKSYVDVQYRKVQSALPGNGGLLYGMLIKRIGC